MSIDFDILIDTEDYSVDMKAGLETLQGASDATRQIAETLLTENVPQRQTSTKKVRTKLKRSFKGSYGQIYSLEITDDALLKRYKEIGKGPFTELVSYFINEALFRETVELSRKAEAARLKLGANEEKLIRQLRTSSLERLHSVSVHFDHDVKLRYRKNRDEQITLTKVDRLSVNTLKPKKSKVLVNIKANITRLNINTGNGRLRLEGANETVAFGFMTGYKDLKKAAKAQFSKNLDQNNVLSQDEWKFLNLKAYPLKLNDGRIVKYLIKDFDFDE